ncbi:MAG: GatB/YqeY domain-containing protein [Candidatus Saccharimonadales bacterium]
MLLEEKINQNLKIALIGGDKLTVDTLRGLKSAILYSKVANNSRDQAMPDDFLIGLLQKEAKKRQESADLYRKGGSEERASQELAEKAIIMKYLPTQYSEAEVAQFVESTIQSMGAKDQTSMAAVINQVRQRTTGRSDGAVIARIVKEKLGL